ncbi:MAG: hypothetical protein WC711_04105 [Candidatus Staskawiczbacteria bacterium]|jgi:hypothetical protein
MIKLKKVGRYGLHPVYKKGKRFYGIASYGDVTEIIPLRKETNKNILRISPRFKYTYSRGKIKQIRATGVEGFVMAKKMITHKGRRYIVALTGLMLNFS